MSAYVRLLVAGLALVALAWPATADAAYPGTNGKLAFAREGQIWAMNADGTGAVQLTHDTEPSSEPEWSPDGARILYTRGTGEQREQRAVNADGSQDAHVYGPEGDGVYSPTWSPGGNQIAFLVAHNCTAYRCWWYLYDIYIAYADGSDARRRFTATANDFPTTDIEWSPRGDEIAFAFYDYYGGYKNVNIWPVGGGSNSNRGLGTYDPGRIQYAPAWSPDGAEVGVVRDTLPPSSPEIDAVDADGTARRQLTDNDVEEYGLDWSPDGQRIVYSGQEPGCADDCNPELHVMNADGTGRVRLTNTAAAEADPDWQPLIDPPALVTYPHPEAATRVRVPLVPAYASCQAPNRRHGPPLAFDSCDPPAQASPKLTVGTPDANGASARSVGTASLQVIADDTTTPADEADVRISVEVSDVRCRPGVNQCASNNPAVEGWDLNGGGDYLDHLRVRLPLRVTDQYNLPAPGADDPGTGDRLQEFTVACSGTQSTDIGSTCQTTISLNAWYPGAVRTGRNAIAELGRIEVLDGSIDINGNEPAPFLRQGIFVP